jgi:hypothetical protein
VECSKKKKAGERRVEMSWMRNLEGHQHPSLCLAPYLIFCEVLPTQSSTHGIETWEHCPRSVRHIRLQDSHLLW